MCKRTMIAAGLCCFAALSPIPTLWAFSGPITKDVPTEYLVDGFDEGKPGFIFSEVANSGAKVLWRGGVAKEGYGSVQVEIPPEAPAGWTFRWSFPEPKDLSTYGVFGFWLMPESDGWHRPFVEIHKKDGWFLAGVNNLDSSKQRVWQRVSLNRDGWRWCNKAGSYDPTPLDLHDVTEIRISSGRAASGRKFSLDSVGFSRAMPVYQGPTVSLDKYGSYLKDRPSILQPTDALTEYTLPLVVGNVPEGEKAQVKVKAMDYFGQTLYDKVFDFVGGDNNQEKIIITDDRPNHIRVQAVLSLKEKDVYQSTVNLGAVEAPTLEDAMPNSKSIFGIWILAPYGEYAQRLGVKWTRVKGSWMSPPDADGQRKVLGELANWQIVEQGVLPITCMGASHPLPVLSDQAGWDKLANDFEMQVRYLSARGNRVYEVANEENAHPGGSREQFVKQNEIFYKAAHKVQPGCEVLGGCTYNVNPEWLEALCKLGGAKWMDGVVMHGYHSPEEFREKVRQVREVMRKYGIDDTKLYITEMGFMAFPTAESEAEQARFVVRAFVYGLAEQVAAILYFDLYSRTPPESSTPVNKAWDLLWFDHQPRPGFIAYAAMTRRLENAKFVRELKMPGEAQQGFEFEKRGQTVLVLWDTKGNSTYALDGKPKVAALFNLLGQETKRTAGADGEMSVDLRADPIYVVYKKQKESPRGSNLRE